MLTRLYVEALLSDEDVADQVWALWDAGVITDDMAGLAWFILATRRSRTDCTSAADDNAGVH
jgi:hypothetical protein